MTISVSTLRWRRRSVGFGKFVEKLANGYGVSCLRDRAATFPDMPYEVLVISPQGEVIETHPYLTAKETNAILAAVAERAHPRSSVTKR